MNRIGTIICTVALLLTGCSAVQAPCPCDAEEVSETSPPDAPARPPLADLPELFYSDSLHVWTWPDSLPRWQGPRAFAWGDSLQFDGRLDTLLGRRFAWGDSLWQAPRVWTLERGDRRRAAWAADMDPGIVIWPDTAVDARVRVFGPGIPPDAIRNFGEEWEGERPRWPGPRLFFERRGPARE